MSDISGDREVLGLEGAAPLPFGDPVEDPGVSPCLLGVLPLDGLVQLGVRETVDRLEGIESISHASNVSRGYARSARCPPQSVRCPERRLWR
jgi:hypothetical protein